MTLKPCPFCGESINITDSSKLGATVWCFHCGVTVQGRTVRGATAAWNRRTPDYEALLAKADSGLDLLIEKLTPPKRL